MEKDNYIIMGFSDWVFFTLSKSPWISVLEEFKVMDFKPFIVLMGKLRIEEGGMFKYFIL